MIKDFVNVEDKMRSIRDYGISELDLMERRVRSWLLSNCYMKEKTDFDEIMETEFTFLVNIGRLKYTPSCTLAGNHLAPHLMKLVIGENYGFNY